MQALLVATKRSPSSRDVANNPYSQQNWTKHKRCSDENLRAIEQRLQSISLGQLLLGEAGKMTAEELSTMTQAQVFELVNGVTAAIAATVSGAVGSDVVAGDDGAARTDLLTSSSRGKYRQTLDDKIGPPGTTSWRDNVKPAMDAGMAAAGLDYKDFPYRETLEKMMAHPPCQKNSRHFVQAGFAADEAEVLQCMQVAPIASEIGAALMHGSPKYSALTHAGYGALARVASAGAVAPKCYHFVTDMYDTGVGLGLGDRDRRWLDILTPDANGFQGFTSYAPLKMSLAASCLYAPDGLKPLYTTNDRADGATCSDVICFESRPADGDVLRSAVDVGGKSFMLPPFTLLTVVRVEQPGTWEYLPGKTMNQRLITVHANFLTPGGRGTTGHEKFACNHNFLRYGTADDMQRGALTMEAPVLTMEQEWARNHKWVVSAVHHACPALTYSLPLPSTHTPTGLERPRVLWIGGVEVCDWCCSGRPAGEPKGRQA
jgi:hypothetical protein